VFMSAPGTPKTSPTPRAGVVYTGPSLTKSLATFVGALLRP
jgi:hypothetical protein